MEDEVLSREELASLATNPMSQIRDRALFCVLYLSLSRVSEIVKRLKKKQIQRILIKDREVLLFQGLWTEKNKAHPIRNVPVVIDKEKVFVDVIEDYLSMLEDDDILFDISRVRAWQIIKRLAGQRCHFLRHNRITHLQTLYNIPNTSIQKMAGWSDERPLKVYAHLRFQDIAELMMG